MPEIKFYYDALRNAWRGSFAKDGKNYVADLAVVPDHHCPEVMIFRANSRGEIISWGRRV